MAWIVKLPDGTTQECATHQEAEALRLAVEATDPRTPEEIYDATDRPKVTREVFLRRTAMGWTPERALNTTPDGRYTGITSGRRQQQLTEQLGGRDAVQHEVLGRTRTLRQWSESCGLSENRLRKGVQKYGTLQNFFLNIGWYPSKPPVPDELTDDQW